MTAGGIAAAASSASVGVAFSSALPAFLAPAASTPASAIPPTIATGGQAVAATPATATDAAVQSQSPSKRHYILYIAPCMLLHHAMKPHTCFVLLPALVTSRIRISSLSCLLEYLCYIRLDTAVVHTSIESWVMREPCPWASSEVLADLPFCHRGSMSANGTLSKRPTSLCLCCTQEWCGEGESWVCKDNGQVKPLKPFTALSRILHWATI